MSVKTVVILGAAGGAGLACGILWDTHPQAEVVLVCDDTPGLTERTLSGRRVPVVTDWDFSALRAARGDDSSYRHFLAWVGDAKVRERMVGKALDNGLEPMDPLVHPRACVIGGDVHMGKGCIVCPGVVVGSNTRMGEHVLLAANAVLGHDCEAGDYVNLNPGCHVVGYDTLGKGVTIGAGAVVNERVCIAPGVFVGAQACVTKDIAEPGITVVGIPARKLG